MQVAARQSKLTEDDPGGFKGIVNMHSVGLLEAPQEDFTGTPSDKGLRGVPGALLL